MDDRQTKIREGAGLEDSRINKEFLDFLNKWSSPVLIVLAAAALVWFGLQKLEQRRSAKIDRAFGELEAATAGGNPSPPSLISIASEYKGVRSVPQLAKLTAVDIHLRAAAAGVEPGAQINQVTRTISNPEDILSEEEREQRLEQARAIALDVLETSENEPSKVLFAMQALSRLAAIEEGLKDFNAARSYYDRLKGVSAKEGYASIATFAQSRMEMLEEFDSVQPLPTREQVPPLPGEAPAVTQEQLDAMIEQAQQQAESEAAESDADNTDTETDAPADTPTEEPAGEEPADGENP